MTSARDLLRAAKAEILEVDVEGGAMASTDSDYFAMN